MRDTSLRPSGAGTRVPVSWTSPAWMLLGSLGLFGLAALVTFARQDSIVFCPIWLGVIGVFGLVMVWHVYRGSTAEATRAATAGSEGSEGRAGEETGQLLASQRRFLQDAAHQLRTPITIALGHAELLASELAGHREQQDIYVVLGELTRLKSLSDRLLLIAASQDPEFLTLAPVALDGFLAEALWRWRPTARRVWTTGQLDAVTVHADRERLELAVDALLENAVQHTGPGDTIRLSVLRDDQAGSARLMIEDSGEGIPAADIDSVFERFRSGPGRGGPRGTGLGLTLVRAVALGHGGETRVRSAPGAGSTFEVVLPTAVPTAQRILTAWRSTRTAAPSGGTEPAAEPAGAGIPEGAGQGAGRWWPGGKRPRPAVVVAAGVCAAVIATVITIDSTTHHGTPVAAPLAPAFTLPSLRDPADTVSLSAYRGVPVIVNFFASWCGPCERETPLLATYYRSLAGKTVIIGVDADDSAPAARRFVTDDKVMYPIGFETTAAVADAYGVSATGIPETFFLNAEHHIVKRILGDVTMRELTEGTALMDGHHVTGPAPAADGYQNRG